MSQATRSEERMRVATTGTTTMARPGVWAMLRALDASRRQQYDLIYALDWGDAATNNYGYAPSSRTSPERYQLEMYEQLVGLLHCASIGPVQRILEISCGRGGGLLHLQRRLGARAIGLDVSRAAIAFCNQRHTDPALRFVVGDASELPFRDGYFDVVVDVEATNDFRIARGLFGEIRRVVRPGGAFLYADSRIPSKLAPMEEALREAGFRGVLRDVTAHIVRACEEDTSRRVGLLRRAVPGVCRIVLRRRLESYLGLRGSRMYEKFRTRRRIYFMSCLVAEPRGTTGS